MLKMSMSNNNVTMFIATIVHPGQPWFVQRGDLCPRIITDLQHYIPSHLTSNSSIQFFAKDANKIFLIY